MAEVGPAAFEYHEDGPARGTPVVNGHPITAVTAFNVRVACGQPSTVTLSLLAAGPVGLVLDGPAHVEVCAGTRAALLSLGWTPPDGPPPRRSPLARLAARLAGRPSTKGAS
jgi:hypothetical protein